MPENKSFIDFVVDAQNDASLANAFFDADTVEALEDFFKKNKYAVSGEDCKKLLAAKDNFPCPPDGVKY